MPVTFEIGQRIRNYTIKKVFAPGAMAMSAQAISESGEVVFFKRYKLPTVRSKWYKGYIEYQAEIKRRIEDSEFKPYSYRFIDFFEENRCYYQVFEFVKDGEDLEQKLDSGRMDWNSRMTFAKSFMRAMVLLHKNKIIHTDLKPANLFLVPDSSVRSGYKLKIIDMDFSILADKTAPWDGFVGYTGTPMYYSPEHLQSGKKPLTKSDVFTCSLILQELLSKNGHPYQIEDRDEYAEKILDFTAKRPVLLGTFGNDAQDKGIEKLLYEALDPNPDNRPSAKDIWEELLGLDYSHTSSSSTGFSPSKEIEISDRDAKMPPPPWEKTTSSDSIAFELPPVSKEMAKKDAKKDSECRVTEDPKISKKSTESRVALLTITNERTGLSLSVPSHTEIGNGMLGRLGEKFSEFYSGNQFIVEQREGRWYVRHDPRAKNMTILDGKALLTETEIMDGSMIAVGRADASIIKLPLKLTFR